jgi:imidazolonepropionase-like amidohydrolase
MKRMIIIAAMILWLTPLPSGGSQRPGGSEIAFIGVSVIPMDRERVLSDQTVVVRDGRIIEIGAVGKVRPPAGATRIEGRGKYLIPGLVDMHTHLLSDDAFPDHLAGDELAIMLANGVTTIRLMIGTPEHLALRREVAAGTLLGPTIFAASPQLAGRKFGRVFHGSVVTTPEEARRAVREYKAAGYDFIKLTLFISRPVYDAVIETAKEVGIRVIGHVELTVGLARALEAGQQIEHLDSYLEALLADDAPVKESVSDYRIGRLQNWESLDYIDETKIDRVAEATARAGVWTCPTQTFFKLAFGIGVSDEEIRRSPDYRFLPAKKRADVAGFQTRYWGNPPSEARRRKWVSIRDRLIRAIHAKGGKILTGSDTPEWFLLYGFTLHRELESLVAAGLSPYAALEAATRNPAEYLGGLGDWGTIERGKRADLVLLDANPLERIAHTTQIAGVMKDGRWLPKAELTAKLDAIASRFEKAIE